MAIRRWMGSAPAHCDLCKGPIKESFVDGATRWGPWACMCGACHAQDGVGTGTGLGQRYERQGDTGIFHKVAG